MTPGNILITGAGGFVGQYLWPALSAAFPAARIAGNRPNAPDPLDITDRASVFARFKSLQPDLCIHLAGITSIGAASADPPLAWAVNCAGAVNLAEAILAHAPQCRLLLVSTAEVYGASFRSGLALDETAALNPLNLYAVTKAAAELACGALTARGLKLLRLRPFNHTGPGQSEAFVVPSFAGQIARIEAGLAPPVLKVGALDPERDFLDVRDVCAAYIAAIKNFEHFETNTIVNIASGAGIKIGAILDTLLALAKCPIRVEQDQDRMRPVEIMRAIGNAGLARQSLAWSPRIPLPETLAAVLAAARGHTAAELKKITPVN